MRWGVVRNRLGEVRGEVHTRGTYKRYIQEEKKILRHE
jgi:hypothetical protein